MSRSTATHSIARILSIMTIVLTAISNGLIVQPAYAAANLTVEIVAAPNLIVDSNVLSPSTYQPIVATVIGKFCNTGGSALNNVVGTIGNYVNGTSDTPGVYPVNADPIIGPAGTQTDYRGNYSFTHLGGTVDATRYIGTLGPGECSNQYWSFTYPKTAVNDANGATIPAWGTSVKPDDDLWLEFDIWGNYPGQTATVRTHRMTMRNEISAMANKIEPNGNPGGQWFNTDTSRINPGETVTTNGILYRLGNINQGFDNNSDGVPDYNAWMQPFGDPAYDPNCFRLIKTTGLLTVTTTTGDVIIPFQDNLYFTDLPDNNTNTVGLVYYTFLALGGACTIPITPYQEVASGSDNEKFNGDYGAGPAPVGSYEPQVSVSKSAPGSVSEGTTFTYRIPFTNTSTTSAAGLTLSSGGIDMPLVIEDKVPSGLRYVCDSAAAQTVLTAPNTTIIYYSTDSGSTWSTNEPASCPGTNPASTGPNSLIALRWKLNNPLPRSPEPGSSGNIAGFQAIAPAGYISGGGNPFVENCAQGKFGTSSPAFGEACVVTVVDGPNLLGDTVWRDDGAGGGIPNNGIQDGTESGLANVTVTLYWDRNGNGVLDSTDSQLRTTTSNGSGTYSFGNLPDGRYIVVVDTTDPDIPIGFGPSTRTKYPIDLDSAHANSGAVTNLTADFGFGPALSLNKALLSNNPAYEGENVTFRIDLRNNLPGDGTASGFCQYKVYAGTTPAADSTPSSGSGNSAFANPANALGAPNETLAASTMANNADTLGLSGFNFSGQTGQITSVQLMVNLHEIKDLQPTQDTFEFRVYRNNAPAQTLAYDGTNLPGPTGTEYVLQSALTGSWTLADFTNNASEVQIYANGSGSPANIGDIGIDAVAFIITTDQVCGGPDSTIATLPVTDTYDADLLGFVSASPAQTTQSTSGAAPNTNGTITWADLGPLYAGQTKSITVTFTALDPGITTTNTINNVIASGAIFANGRPVNSANASANVNIVPTGSITGVVYSDRGTIGWVGTNGFENLGTTDFGIPGATVTLWGCYDLTTNLLISSPDTGRTCQASQQNGQWRVVTTTTTTSSGAYSFAGLREGYYYVQVTPPAWAGASQSAEAGSSNTNQNGTGRICGTCDNTWGDISQNLNTTNFNPVGTQGNPNESITNVNFGYQTVPARLFGKVYEDNNGDGDQDSGERNLSGVTVRLCSDAACTAILQTVVTAADGTYGFSIASPAGSYYVQINGGTPLTGTVQTDDPDNNGACSGAGGCDNRTNALTVVAGQSSGSHDFGYQPSGIYGIGDTLYRDWNGDGAQNSGEEGLPNITVALYEDENNNGVRDPEDALIAVTATNAAGSYTFNSLPNGNYLVVVDTADADFPAGHTQTADPDGACPGAACDSRSTSAAINNASDLDNDFGYRPVGFGSIGDTVWFDRDADGAQDAGEAAAPNVSVRLYQDQDGDGVIDPEDALVGITMTNSSGLYSFNTLPSGNFIVQIDPAAFNGGSILAGYTLTTDGAPYNTTQVSYAVTLGAGQIFSDADFGFATTAVGDFIWQDNDGDGLADTGEPGINGVVMELYRDVDNSGTLNAADTLYGTATTANNSSGAPGYYLFGGMPEGNYIVRVAQSNFSAGGALYNFTLTADPDVYNDTNPSSVSCLTTGAQGCDNLKPYDRYASGSANDENPAIRAGTIELTADFGYQPRGVIGDTVWIDADNNGVRDANEQGIPDVTVWLCASTPCNASTAGVITTTTDATGEYSYGGLTNGQTYYIRVNTSDPDFPAGLTQTYGTAEPSRTINTSVNNGIDLTVDFGYRFSGTNTISGTAWNDADSGGQTGGTGDIDPSETVRYSNVPVYLWHCGSDAICGNGDDTLAGSTSTDAAGQYSFSSLAAGTYRVVINANTYSLRGTTATTTTDYDGTPATNSAVTFTGENQTARRDFGFLSTMDLGDLPDTYNNTLLADNGARHTIGTLFLGVGTTIDPDGRESASAAGDTDDGVVYTPNVHWQVATGGSVNVTVSGCAGTCYLSGWFDWNNDGDFVDAGERILLDQAVSNGTQTITFAIPTGTTFPNSFNGRFRLYSTSTSGLAQPTGLVNNGEVEDYQWNFGPTAVTLNSIAARAEPGMPLTLLIFLVMGIGATLLIVWARRHRLA
jgi:hypothetical protein